MNCNQARDHLLDVAQQAEAAARVPGLDEHLRACAACASELESLRQTMVLLDQWEAPELSPYFDSRLRARRREVAAESPGWLQWLRKPAIAFALAALLVAGVTLFRGAPSHVNNGNATVAVNQAPKPVVQTGTAVDDLQQLDHDGDMYANFDLLDEIGGQNQELANP